MQSQKRLSKVLDVCDAVVFSCVRGLTPCRTSALEQFFSCVLILLEQLIFSCAFDLCWAFKGGEYVFPRTRQEQEFCFSFFVKLSNLRFP